MTKEERRAKFLARQRASAAANLANGRAADFDPHAKPPQRRKARREPRPVFGSAEWCETSGDDMGLSHD